MVHYKTTWYESAWQSGMGAGCIFLFPAVFMGAAWHAWRHGGATPRLIHFTCGLLPLFRESGLRSSVAVCRLPYCCSGGPRGRPGPVLVCDPSPATNPLGFER